MTAKLTTLIFVLLGAYFLALVAYAIFSYSLTAPNLILTSWAPYWRFQMWMWQTFFNNRQLLTYGFSGLFSVLIGLYCWIMYLLKTQRVLLLNPKAKLTSILFSPLLIGYCFLVAPLVFSNNALSYDVFNYIFNAKMVVVYQANPHQQVALDFAQDDWVRFMHNTHTPAPYGYGWTVFSVLPYVLGGGKFLVTWLLFRLLSVMSLVLMVSLLTYWYLKNIPRDKDGVSSNPPLWPLALVALNPLFLIEIVSNSHNDLWMMIPAVLSLILVQQKRLASSILALVVSISIKLATFVLIPVWLLLVLSYLEKRFRPWVCFWALFASFFLFVPLFTLRSQQFHPWYLTWSLVWVPLILQIPAHLRSTKYFSWRYTVVFSQLSRIWSLVLVSFSVTSLYRYLPYLWRGDFEGSVLLQQKVITWSAIGLGLMATLFFLSFLKIQMKQNSKG